MTGDRRQLDSVSGSPDVFELFRKSSMIAPRLVGQRAKHHISTLS